jgi:hypothetical protein
MFSDLLELRMRTKYLLVFYCADGHSCNWLYFAGKIFIASNICKTNTFTPLAARRVMGIVRLFRNLFVNNTFNVMVRKKLSVIEMFIS